MRAEYLSPVLISERILLLQGFCPLGDVRLGVEFLVGLCLSCEFLSELLSDR